ncbi:MAG: radical SAM protein [bacterium]|nr:radical SAM protein [bacterium]
MSAYCRDAATLPIAGLEFTEAEIEETVRNHGLLSMELEMTHACNLRCVYCYSSAGRPIEHELSLDELKDVVTQAADLGARKIVLLGGGEPLLYPHLRELVAVIHSRDLRIELFTSGTLLDRDMASFLYEHGVDVVVKRNSADPAIQDELAGVPGTFALIERCMDALFAAGYPDAAHALGIQTVIVRQNYHEIPSLWRWARDRNILPYFECMTIQGRAVDHQELHITLDETRAIFDRLAAIDQDEYGIVWSPRPPLVGSTCARHRYSTLVKANGDIQPCVGVALSVANVRKDRLADVIRENPVVRELRDIYNNVKGKCRSCEHNGECYGCRGNAFQLTGDYLESDPHCWLCGE